VLSPQERAVGILLLRWCAFALLLLLLAGFCAPEPVSDPSRPPTPPTLAISLLGCSVVAGLACLALPGRSRAMAMARCVLFAMLTAGGAALRMLWA
jgi:hypothetical protein